MKIAYGIGKRVSCANCERLIFILRASLLCVYNFIVAFVVSEHNAKRRRSIPFSCSELGGTSAHPSHLLIFARSILSRYDERIECMRVFGGIHSRTEGQVYLFIVRMHMRKCYFSDFMNASDHVYFPLEDFCFYGKKENIIENMEECDGWMSLGRRHFITAPFEHVEKNLQSIAFQTRII